MEKQGFQIVPFETIKEDWSIYKLRDKSVVKVRYVLIKILKSAQVDVFGNPIFDLNYATVVGVIPDPSLLGSPSVSISVSPEILNKSIVEKDISFDPITEPWNEYQTEGKIIKTKLILTKIARTSVFNERGEPAYLINTQPITTMEG